MPSVRSGCEVCPRGEWIENFVLPHMPVFDSLEVYISVSAITFLTQRAQGKFY